MKGMGQMSGDGTGLRSIHRQEGIEISGSLDKL